MSGPGRPEERFVDVRGLRLHLRAWPGEGPASVLLHGWLDHCGSFDPLAPAAAALLAQGGVSPDPAQDGALAWKWDPLLRAHSPLPFTDPALQALLRQVSTPVLLLRGERGFVPDEPAARERLSALRDLRIATLAGVSHHLHLEKPAEVAALVLEAWRALDRPAAPAASSA